MGSTWGRAKRYGSRQGDGKDGPRVCLRNSKYFTYFTNEEWRQIDTNRFRGEEIVVEMIEGYYKSLTLTSVPIAAGQHVGSKMSFRDLITVGKIDVAQPDVQNVGGFTEGVKVGYLAQAYNLPFATHALPMSNMHLVGRLSNGIFVEWHYTVWREHEKIYKQSPKPDNGWIKLPDRPGLGLTLNENALSESLIT